MGGVIVAGGAILGLVIGSFLNVVAYRVPRGLSVVSPPSACPHCGTEIHVKDNIPVVSWILLRGRCRHCHAGISVRYPFVELVTAVALAGTAWWWANFWGAPLSGDLLAWSLGLAAFLTLAVASVVLAVIDFAEHRLPNAIVYPTTVIVFVLLVASSIVAGEPLRAAQLAVGAAALGGLYAVIWLISPSGMGFGDVKMSVMLGGAAAWVGYPALVVAGFAPFLLGGTFALLLVAVRRAARRTAIPFGPWMLVGVWLGIVAGETLVSSYLSVWGL